MNNQDTFQKIPVRKKPNTKNKNMWKFNRKMQRKLKQQQQEKFCQNFQMQLLVISKSLNKT